MSVPATTSQTFSAELVGTFVLVFFGVGTAIMTQGDYVATGLPSAWPCW